MAKVWNAITKQWEEKSDYTKKLSEETIKNKKTTSTTNNKLINNNIEDENKKWYQRIFTKGEFADGTWDKGDLTKTVLGTGTEATQRLSKGLLKPVEDAFDIGTNIVATGANLLGFEDTAEKIRNFADKDLVDNATKVVSNVNPIGMAYNIVNGTPEKIINPAEITWDKNKGIIDNYTTQFKKAWLDEAETQDYENSSISGEYADKALEGLGYLIGLAFGGSALSGASKTKAIGLTTKAGKTALGVSANAGNVGLTLMGKTLNIPTLAFVGGAAGGLEEANSKENVSEWERWSKAVSSGTIVGVTEGITGMFGVGGIADDVGKEIFDVLGEKATKLFVSKAGKVFSYVGIKATGETGEEFLEYALNYLVDNHIIDKMGDADFSKEWDWEELGEQLALAYATSLIAQGGNTVISTNSAIKSAEQQLGRKLSNSEKTLVTQASIEGTVEEKIRNLEARNGNEISTIQNVPNNQVLAPLSVRNAINNTSIQETPNVAKNGVEIENVGNKEYAPYIPVKGQENINNNLSQIDNVTGTNETSLQQQLENDLAKKMETLKLDTETLTNDFDEYLEYELGKDKTQVTDEDINTFIETYNDMDAPDNNSSDTFMTKEEFERAKNIIKDYIKGDNIQYSLNEEAPNVSYDKIDIDNQFEKNGKIEYNISQQADVISQKKYNKITTKITKNEQAQVSSEVNYWRNKTPNGIGFINLSKNGYKSYIYEKNGYDVHTIARVDGTEEFKAFVEKEVNDGNFTSTERSARQFEILKNRYRNNSVYNDGVSGTSIGTTNDGIHSVYGRQQGKNNSTNVSEQGGGDNKGLENSSFFSEENNDIKKEIEQPEGTINSNNKVNKTMTMQEAKQMMERAFNAQDIKGYYDGKYQNADEWLQGEGIDDVALTIDSIYEIYNKYLSKLEGYGEDYTLEDILQAYQDGTLVGTEKFEPTRIDISKEQEYKDTRFYAPRVATKDDNLFAKASERVTNANRQEVYQARSNFIINAHTEGYLDSLGITPKQFIDKSKSWANYTNKAMELSNNLNKNVASQNKWTGIENSSIVNTVSITDEQLNSLVKEIKGNSDEYKRNYIVSTMLAIDTHVNYKNLTFEFGQSKALNEKSEKKVLGDFNRSTNTIRIGDGYQNTVAHEMGHYIDHLWGNELGLGRELTDVISETKLNELSKDQRQFIENFKGFMNELENTSDIRSNYSMSSNEVFARFVGRFVEWTKNVATNNRYGYESKYYNDNFTESQYKEFVKLLQEKAYLDTTGQTTEYNKSYNQEETKEISQEKQDIKATDNQGRTLTKEQQEYFKDSKVRDEEGRLLEVYHGTPEGGFTIFDRNKTSRKELKSQFGTGFYFTNDRRAASDYNYDEDIYGNTVTGEKPKTYEVYLDIKNPLMLNYKNMNEHNLDRNKIKELLLRGDNDYFFDNYISFITQTPDALNYKVDGLSKEEINNLSKEDRVDYWLRGTYDLKNFGDKEFLKTMHRAYKNNSDLLDNFQDIFGYDGIIMQGAGKTNQYVVFNPNQIKNVDNTNPTDDPDIRYSLEEETETKTKKPLTPLEISKLIPEDANTTPKLKDVKVSSGEGKSKFADNILDKTDMLSFESKNTILKDSDVKYYKEVTNKESLEKAFSRLNENGQAEVMNWMGKKSEAATSIDIAEGWILLKQYQDAIEKTKDANTKDYLNRSMVQVAKKMREIGTKAGQTVQAFNIMNRLTPEGMVYYAQSELSEAYEIMVKGKTQEWIDKHKSDFELSPVETKFIMDTMQEVMKMKDGYEKNVKLAQIQKVMTDKLPPEKGAGIKAWMRISMLFNPKTQVRNVLGNAVIAPVNSVSDLIASKVDKAISKTTGVRTTGTTNLKSYAKGFKTGMYQSYNDFKLGINTRNIEGNRFEITQGKSFNNNTKIGKKLNQVDSLLSFMLDAGDRGFYEAAFTNSINNQLVLNNTTEVTQEMIDIATTEALQRTWQDNNGYTKFVLNVRKGLNAINVKGYGLGDILIPFAKTPANLTKAIVDYSPVGMVKAMVEGNNLKNAIKTGQFTPQQQHKFVQDLGKGVAGTMLYILGYALAQAGITTGESDEDKDVANFMKNTLGVNSYSIKIGNKSFTYDWAQPIAAPLAIMANYSQKQKVNPDASAIENLISSLDVAGNVLLEQSFMESINTVLSNRDGIATGIQEAIVELPSRAVPTFLKQIVDLTDPTQRQSFVYDKPLESAYNKVIAKIPGASYALAPTVDTMGREVKKYGGKNNIFNVLFNPATVNTENISRSAEEIYNLYKETGNSAIMPKVTPYYINNKGEKIVLTNEQRGEFQKISGDLIEKEVQKLLKSSNYKSMSSEDKAKVIEDIVNYSYNKAKLDVLGMEISTAYEKTYEYVSNGGNISDYYTFTNSIDDTDSQTKKASVVNYLVNSTLSNEEIAKLYAKYYSSEEKMKLLTSLNISVKEFIKLNSQDFESDYNSNGKAISGSKQKKLFNYINSLNLSAVQKAVLMKLQYPSYKAADKKILEYINKQSISKYEKCVMAKQLGFDNYDNYIINYIMKLQALTEEEKIKKLEQLGFNIINGKIY